MKKLLSVIFLLTLVCISSILNAQPSQRADAKTLKKKIRSSTNWVAMMRDRNVNVHDVQKAFYKWYKKNHHEDEDKEELKSGKAEGEEDEAYEAFKRWEWYNLPRADKEGNRPDPYKIASDYGEYLENNTTNTSIQPVQRTTHAGVQAPITSTGSWTYAGNTTVPSNSSTGNGGDGRVNRVRLYPGNNNIIFACAASGGLWKTTNGGTTWSENTDQLGDLTTSDIAINPLNTNIMYLATGDGDGIQSIYPTPATIGILKSYDGGNTWNATSLAYTLSVSGADYYSVNEILIDPNDTSVILAATTFGIYRSANSGATWTQTSTATWFHSIEFEPGHPSIVYAGTSNVINGVGANFYRSTNNGISWTKVTSGLPSSTAAEGFEIGVTAADSNDVYLLADNTTNYGFEGLYLSTNDGVSFSTQSTSPDVLGWESNGGNDGGQGWYTLSMAVSQTNADSVFVGGVNIWASSNSGVSWKLNSNWEGTPYVHADIHHIQFIPGTKSEGYVVGCDGGVFITSNSGKTWMDISNNLEIGQQYCIGPSASTAGAWITGWQDNGTNFSSNPWAQVYGGDGMDCFIDWSNNNNYYAETAEGGMVKSTNAGATWSNAAGGITETGPWITIWLQDHKTSTTLYSGFSNVWKSTNSAGTWSKISSWGGTGSISGLAVDSANNNYIYAAQANLIELTTNGGTSWTNITGTLPVSSTSISAIAVSAKTPSHVWVTFAGYSSGNEVFASTNSGSTWTNISSGLPNLPVNTIVSESGSPNGIYIGTDQGVYYHDTVLNSWVFYNTGLPLVMIGDLKIYEPGKELLAATYGRGTWESALYTSSSSSCTLSATANTTTNVNCNGGDNGSVSSSVSGGTSPYTYVWTGGGTSSSKTGLSTGNYTITVTDNIGCTASASTSITQPALLTASASTTANVSCNGNNNGSVSASASGGTSPYTYSWTGGSVSSIETGLSAGTYTVTVKDKNGCSATASAILTQPASALGISISSVTNVSCSGEGSITANTATGGTLPYTYSWSGSGGTNLTATNLNAGTYTIIVTDSHGCIATASATITQSTQISISASTTANVSCNGSNNGSVSASASGGTSPYTYSWTGGGTGSTETGLSAGTYTVTIKDKNGCSATASAIVTQPASVLGISISSVANANCSEEGSITANAATGGTSPYTYSWSGGGGTNLTATNLNAGTYTITVTDSHGCIAAASATITQSTQISISASTTANVSCNGSNNGSVSASASGGTSPYTYSWTGGSVSSIETGLSAGTYTVTVKDKNGCSATASAILTQPASALGISISSVTNVSCSGEGSITANTATGGTLPYTYSWSGSGGTNLTATNLNAGTYTIIVTDSHGCIATASATITQSTQISISASTTANVSCNGSNNGSVSASASGGTSPYTYSWTGGGTGSTETGLSAGTYTVTIKDKNGCSATASATVTQPASVLGISISSITNITCSGEGSIIANVATGGTSPYTYTWSPNGGNNLTATGLGAGTYTITVIDNNGCTADVSATVTQPASVLGISISSVTNVSCSGEGSITANAATGGTSPYTYTWSPNGGNNLTATGLGAGTYTITVIDNNGCTADVSATVTQPASVLGISISSVTNVSCSGEGSITANAATGGTSPYTYTWSPNGGNNLTATGLGAGTYTITVIDNNGCTADASANVTQPASVLGISISFVTNVSCSGEGSITANAATGGTSPYTYTWSPSGGNSLIATGLGVGTYTITVIDNNGCTADASATVTQPASALGISISSVTNVSCSGEGSITANAATGGTSPYTYTWSPSGGNNLTATGLGAGTYTITVIDNNGCTADASATVTQPASALGISISSVTNLSCSGEGSITANAATGGTSPYTYIWSPNGGNNLIATGLGVGTYTITVIDNNGCTASSSASVMQYSSLSITASVIANASCNGSNNGSGSVSASGGSGPYTYSWSNSAITASISSLTAGKYTVTVTDNNGCSASSSITITQTTTVKPITSTTTNVSCNGGTNGVAKASVTGGASPYTYSWSPAGGNTYIASNLSAGAYILTVTDKNGCTGTSSTTVTQPAALRDSVATSITYPSCSVTTGSVTIGVKGGAAPYTYIWSPNVSTTATATGLSVRSYVVQVKDHNGCYNDITIAITEPPVVRDSIVSSSTVSVPCSGAPIGSATVGVKYGTPPYTFTWTLNVSTTATASGLSTGVYSVTVTDATTCSASASVTITQTTGATVLKLTSTVADNVSCNGGTNGETKVSVTGGATPYTYAWSPNSNNTYINSGLSAGVYMVTVTDNNGCSNTGAALTVTQPAALRDSVTVANPVCNGGTGSAVVGVKGGTLPYSYTWTPSVSTTASASGLSARSYLVQVKDNHGCYNNLDFSITQPPVVRDSIVKALTIGVLCNGAYTGSATVGVKYGTSPYTYSWSPDAGNTAKVTGLSAGTYSVTVTANNGCTGATVAVTITQTAALSASISSSSCSKGLVTATVGVKGGKAPYSYSWSPGSYTTATVSGLSPGTYTIVVKDNNDCSATITPSLSCPGNISPDAPQQANNNAADLCCPGSDVNIYPNPNTGQFTITGISKDMMIDVYDFTGRKIIHRQAGGNETMQLNISDQANGIYLIRITDNNGNLLSEKKTIKMQ